MYYIDICNHDNMSSVVYSQGRLSRPRLINIHKITKIHSSRVLAIN